MSRCQCPPPINGLRAIMGDAEWDLFVRESFGLIPPRKPDWSKYDIFNKRLPSMAVVLDSIDKRIGY
jgi:hypothetical protein